MSAVGGAAAFRILAEAWQRKRNAGNLPSPLNSRDQIVALLDGHAQSGEIILSPERVVAVNDPALHVGFAGEIHPAVIGSSTETGKLFDRILPA